MPQRYEMTPKINVTPLIDVLLVLLIIFMVISPAKSSRFEAKIPSEPRDLLPAFPNPQTLVVSVSSDSLLRLNNLADVGSVDNPAKLTEMLSRVFRERSKNAEAEARGPESVERTVFVKARRSTSYGDVAKIVDAVKASGASPISLMIDNLE